MTDNNKLRDMIMDMEASLSTNLSGYSMWHYGAIIHGITRETLKNAIEALKAQEPRVIQFDEIDDYEVLWLEVRDIGSEEGLAPWVKTRSGNWFSPLLCSKLQPDMILSTPEEYGKFCRCWTSRPTDEQREATPWN